MPQYVRKGGVLQQVCQPQIRDGVRPQRDCSQMIFVQNLHASCYCGTNCAAPYELAASEGVQLHVAYMYEFHAASLQ